MSYEERQRLEEEHAALISKVTKVFMFIIALELIIISAIVTARSSGNTDDKFTVTEEV